MRRRTFIAGLGSAAAWPVLARAQQGDRVRRIGVLMGGSENDPEQKRRLTAFTQSLADLGWIVGRNMQMDVHWGGGDTNRIRALAKELVGLQPDIILTNGLPATAAVRRETPTLPVVFVGVGDPVASRIVARLDRPSENVAGFAIFESSLGGKWLQLLSEIAPGLKRAAVMFNLDTSPEWSTTANRRGGKAGAAASTARSLVTAFPVMSGGLWETDSQQSWWSADVLRVQRMMVILSNRGVRPCKAKTSRFRLPPSVPPGTKAS
jgi:putative ABC transport system substrate-binding protein